jgi:luciferase-type oxidoreductase
MKNNSPEQSANFQRVFRDQQLSIGLTLPMLRAEQTVADLDEQLELARTADELGFRALWIRDVPLNSADYPDPVGHLDPWVLLGALATRTRRIALVSGAIVLPLRHPLHIAKATISTSILSHDRFILGVGAGDRPLEYAALGKKTDERRELFRCNWEVVAAAIGMPSRVIPDLATPDTPEFYLLPELSNAVPMLAVGSGGQSIDWIARNACGWITYHREPEQQRDRYALWRAAVERSAYGAFRAFGVAMKLDLSEDPDEPAAPIPLGYRAGRKDLLNLLRDMRDNGTHHVSLNLSVVGRHLREVLDELAAEVLPEFHADDF